MNLCRCFIVTSDSESGILPRSMKVLVTSYFLSCFLSDTAKTTKKGGLWNFLVLVCLQSFVLRYIYIAS